jgi:hypothetical protein
MLSYKDRRQTEAIYICLLGLLPLGKDRRLTGKVLK